MKEHSEWKDRIGETEFFFNTYSGWINLPDVGMASVVVGANEDGMEHVSVAPVNKHKLPTWNDMCYVKNIFWDDEEEAYQIMPKKSEYVNIKGNCLHLWKPIGKELRDLHGKTN